MTNPFELFVRYLSNFFVILAVLGKFLLSVWWIYIPIILLILIRDLWLKHVRNQYVNKREWVSLEIIPPKEVKKTPKAIEQFFAALHATQSGPNAKDRYMNGKTQDWFSMEMVSRAGEIHFLIRTPVFYRNLIEAQVYAQYPEAEIVEVADYVHSIPENFIEEGYDLWGTELVFTMDDAYPIRTYPAFEKDILVEEQRIDPLSSLMEVMAKIGDGEQIWIQTLVRPVDDKWKKAGEELRDKLVNRAAAKAPEGIIMGEIKGLAKEARSQASVLATGERWDAAAEEKKEESKPLTMFTKGEMDVVKAIEDDIAKFGYETIIRFIYVATIDRFNKVNVPAVIGAYKQFGSQNLNGFKPNKPLTTSIDYKIQLKTIRETFRKRRILNDYKKRDFILHSNIIGYLKPFFFERLPILKWFFGRSKPIVLNTEELATVYHFPSEAVRAPMVPKMEAKKGQPPVMLPVE